MVDMKRREFITLVGGAASPVLWPCIVRAQQPTGRMPHIAYLAVC